MCGVLAADPAGELPQSRTVETLSTWMVQGLEEKPLFPGATWRKQPWGPTRGTTVVAAKGPLPTGGEGQGGFPRVSRPVRDGEGPISALQGPPLREGRGPLGQPSC